MPFTTPDINPSKALAFRPPLSTRMTLASQTLERGAHAFDNKKTSTPPSPQTVRGPSLRFSLPRTLDRGLCKSGVRFLAPFLGPPKGILILRGRIRGPPGGPQYLLPAIFFSTFSLHCCLGPSFVPGRAWSREPSCWDLARAIPRLFPRSACRRKPAAWLPRCGARALNPQALKPGSPSALKPFRLEGDLKPYALDALEPFSPQAFKDSCPCAVTFLSPQALQLQA